ncbi:MAG: DNA repair protein RadA [Flavobacteriales bacterium]|nr:DNA repair protein RadA [Flavobacteriales bacterium]
MAKARTRFVCSDCGHVTGQWVGRCPSCKEWNTVTEFKESANPRMERAAVVVGAAEARPLIDYTEHKTDRTGTGEAEFDRVLGGGLVPGALVLLGGEPGIGKSTLSLQTAMKAKGKVLYVSGEESPEQVRLRADRLGTLGPELLILPETSTEGIVRAIKDHRPDLLFVDSIQTLHTPRVESAPGSVAQVRESTAELILAAKPLQLPVVLIGHITKEGAIAGPKVLEHMVDVVLTFEGDRHHAYRILRAAKNRFGSTQEIGIFEMRGDGLHAVTDPSGALVGNSDVRSSGTALAVAIEGARPLMVEIQALVSSAVYGTPQRSATGYELKRLNMLLAVLEKRCGFKLGASDVFLNLAGGIRLGDPGIDLAVVGAILSSTLDLTLDPNTALCGEVGLTGEVRPVARLEQRMMEASKLGMERLVISGMSTKGPDAPKGLKLIRVKRVGDLQKVLF